MIVELDNVLITSDLWEEYFACDYTVCKGACCIEGDAGAPITVEEVAETEAVLDSVKPHLSSAACLEIGKSGICYVDKDGELVTSIINGRDCVFVNNRTDGCAECVIEREGHTKPLSCSLYPLRMKKFNNTTGEVPLAGLNYHRWDICSSARARGLREDIKLYQFLRVSLVKTFGQEWYNKLLKLVDEVSSA